MSDRFKQLAPVNARDWADGGLARSVAADQPRAARLRRPDRLRSVRPILRPEIRNLLVIREK
jgi:hypothetical protein